MRTLRRAERRGQVPARRVKVPENSRLARQLGGGLTTAAGVDGIDGEGRVRTYLNYIGSDFFRTLGIPLLAGRGFGDSDTGDAPQAAIVTQRFAERLGSGRDVIGRRVTLPGADAEIVGLAADAKYVTVTGETEPQVFLPRTQASFVSGSATFYVQAARPPEVLMKRAAGALLAMTSTAFAVLATALAALGLPSCPPGARRASIR